MKAFMGRLTRSAAALAAAAELAEDCPEPPVLLPVLVGEEDGDGAWVCPVDCTCWDPPSPEWTGCPLCPMCPP